MQAIIAKTMAKGARKAKCMLKAKKKCRTRCARRVPFSETVNKEGAGVCFHKLAIKSKSGSATRMSLRQKNVSSGKISRVQKKVGLQHVKWNVLGINTPRSLLEDQKWTHNNVKKNGRKHCKSHLRQMTLDTVKKEEKDPDAIEKHLLHRD